MNPLMLEKVTEQISVLTTERKKAKNKKRRKGKERDESKEIEVDYLPASEPPKTTASPAAQPNPTGATEKTNADEVLNVKSKYRDLRQEKEEEGKNHKCRKRLNP
ncbi:hypothetical protein AVEN_63826-1 [Araneus ventricosus]|uniref:Uncharacterized protein n=1 Tax=Araneus ventricosus TaxID=182803 RepID=A0A4Y2FZY0_ARAVE|nr:hypothetical protein AVEN_63826-1 [Araneus ventricosus]